MSVQITQDAELGRVMDLFVKMVKYERRLGTPGVFVSYGTQRFPPGRSRQFVEHVLPEFVRTIQDGQGFRGRCRRRVIPLAPAR
jgi:hypothetical protein